MDIAVRASFWVVTFGGLGYAMFKLAKPNEELLKKYEHDSKHTDTRRLASQTLSVLKDSTKQDSELTKKIEDLLKK